MAHVGFHLFRRAASSGMSPDLQLKQLYLAAKDLSKIPEPKSVTIGDSTSTRIEPNWRRRIGGGNVHLDPESVVWDRVLLDWVLAHPSADVESISGGVRLQRWPYVLLDC